MAMRANLAVIPGRSAGSSPEPITAGRTGTAATSSQPTMFMDSRLDASRRPGMTV
jgi:hypothetical protein